MSRAAVILISVIPLLVVVGMRVMGIPFGRPGGQVYLYSDLLRARFLSVAVLLAVFAAMFPLWNWLARVPVPSRRTVWVVTLITLAVLGVWTHLAPPWAAAQHFFNLQSPSHEGAFVLESRRIASVREYLSSFPSQLERTPDQMRGTRVLGNPPGLTILSFGAGRVVERWPWVQRAIIALLSRDMKPETPEAVEFTRSTLLSWVYSGAWIASGVFIFLAAGFWMPPRSAMVLTLICTFNPSSAMFSPGKDPAQLLLIGVMMWAWTGAVFHGRWWSGVIAGVVVVVGLVVGLVHAWIALILAAAAVWSNWSDRAALRKLAVRGLLPCVIGVVAALAVGWMVWRWNIVASVWAAGRGQLRVLNLLGRPPWQWIPAKIAMFALVAGGGMWVLAAEFIRERIPDATGRFGRSLVWCTLAVMAYSCVHTLLETPRLWLAFVPTLGLGLAMSTPRFRRADLPGVRMLLMVAALHVATTALQWGLFDPRESESRLFGGRLFS